MTKDKSKEKSSQVEDEIKDLETSEENGENSDEKTELETLKSELTASQDKYLRLFAEFENSRKRFEKEKQDLYKYGNEKLVKDLLNVLDSLDKALEAQVSESNPDAVLDGVKMVKESLVSTLDKHGLSAIDAEGQPFDPEKHQAIQRVESEDVDSEQVDTVYAKGYTLNDRLLRASMVSVKVPAG